MTKKTVESSVLNDLFELEEAEKKSNKTIADKRSQLKDEICQGTKTTGDRITDFLIVCDGYRDKEFEEKLRSLDKEISEHPGEFVLVVYTHRERHTHGGPGYKYDESDFHDESDYYFGVLSPDSRLLVGFIPNKLYCAIPVGKFASLDDDDTRKGIRPKVINGDISEIGWGIELVYLLFRHDGTHSVKIFVGDEKVIQWFRDQAALYFGSIPTSWFELRELMSAIGRVIEVPEIIKAVEDRKNQVVREVEKFLTFSEQQKKTLKKLIDRLKEIEISDDEIRTILSGLIEKQLAGSM